MIQLDAIPTSEHPVEAWLHDLFSGCRYVAQWTNTPGCQLNETLHRLQCSKIDTYHKNVIDLAQYLELQARPNEPCSLKWDQKLLTGTPSPDWLNPRQDLRYSDEACTAAVAHFTTDVERMEQEDLEELAICAGRLLGIEPDRRYTLGFVVGSTPHARLFKCERSHFSMTEPFNFSEHATYLCQYILFLGLATMENLGYDQTVSRLKDPTGDTSFLFKVEGGFYRTIGPPTRQDGMLSQGRRIWPVKAASSEGDIVGSTTHLLKDVWLDVQYHGERNAQKRILSSLDEGDGECLKDHFLVIIAEERVHLSDGKGDATSGISEGRAALQHWRLVTEDCQDPLSRSVDLRTFLEAAIDVVDSLNLLRKGGWVHRNVHPGSFSVRKTPQQRVRGVLSDFEAVGEYMQLNLRDVKTNSFSADEIVSGQFHWGPDVEWTPCEAVSTPIFHHPYHDLESLYRVILLGVVSWIPLLKDSHMAAISIDDWWSLFRTLFTADARPWLLTNESIGRNFAKAQWDREAGAPLLPILHSNRALTAAYVELQSQPPQAAGGERWDLNRFTSTPYTVFKEALLSTLEKLPRDRKWGFARDYFSASI